MRDLLQNRGRSTEAPLSMMGQRNRNAYSTRAPERFGDSTEGCALYQDCFFLFDVKTVGDIPEASRIYVEMAVDRASGAAFAKICSGRNAMNGIEVLAGRAIPFFERQGVSIGELHTRNTIEYCGLAPKHPFELCLATHGIQHVTIATREDPYYFLCEQFYWFLLTEFFQPALRKTFPLSIGALQRELDAFLEAYNSNKHARARDASSDAA